MYFKLIKKYYIYKIFTLSLPLHQKSNKPTYYLCKYTLNNTAYANISSFITEIYRVLSPFLYLTKGKRLLFISTKNVYTLNLTRFNKKKFNYLNWKKNSFFNDKNLFANVSLILLYNINYTQKILAFLKDQKTPSLGFINFQGQPNVSDYTLLLETKFFSCIFLFHFLLKKFALNVKN